MSEKIPTLGKVWLIFLTVVQVISAVINLVAGFVNPLFFLIALLCVGAVVSLVFILQGKGKNYLISYCACYGIATVVSNFFADTVDTAKAVGLVIGLVINFALTYLAAKNTIEK